MMRDFINCNRHQTLIPPNKKIYVIGEDIGLNDTNILVPSRATGKIKILFRILIFIFVERREKYKTRRNSSAQSL